MSAQITKKFLENNPNSSDFLKQIMNLADMRDPAAAIDDLDAIKFYLKLKIQERGK